MARLRAQKSTNVRPLVPPALRAAIRWGERVAPELTARWLERVFLTPRRLRRPIPEEAVLLTATRGSVRYQGMEIPTWSWGEGPTVLLVHGWEGRGSQLARPYAHELTECGYRVVTFDMPGHGDAPAAQMSVLDFAEVAHRVARVVGPVHAIIAHSVGGAGVLLAQQRAHIADRLVIIAAPTSPREYFPGFADLFGLGEAMRQRVIERLQARYGVLLDSVNTLHEAHNVHVPVLVVHDVDDPAVAFRHGAELAAALPQATLMTTHGLAHQRVLREASVVARVVAHLRPQPRRTLAEVIDMELFTPALRGVA